MKNFFKLLFGLMIGSMILPVIAAGNDSYETCIKQSIQDKITECIDAKIIDDKKNGREISDRNTYNQICQDALSESFFYGIINNRKPLDINFSAAGNKFPDCNKVSVDKFTHLRGELFYLNQPLGSVKIKAINQQNKKIYSTFTLGNGSFDLELTPGEYQVEFDQYGGKTINIDSADLNIGKINLKSFILQGLTNFSGIIVKFTLPNRFEPILIKSGSSLMDPIGIIPSKYDLQIFQLGYGKIYAQKNLDLEILDKEYILNLNLYRKVVDILGLVSDGNIMLPNAYIELQKQIPGANSVINVTSDELGMFKLQVPEGNYKLTVSKMGYQKYIQSIEVLSSGTNMPNNIILNPIQSEIIINGKISSTANFNSEDLPFVSLNGYNKLNQSQIWFGNKLNKDNTYSFKVPKGFNWQISVKADGYRPIHKILPNVNDNVELNLEIIPTGKPKKILTEKIKSNQKGQIVDKQGGLKLEYSANTFGSGATQEITIKSKQTENLPVIFGKDPIGNKGFELEAEDTIGNKISQFQDNLNIQLQYNGIELVSTYTGIKLADVDSLQVYYFDEKKQNWLPLQTIVEITGINLNEYKNNNNILVKNIKNYQNMQINLKSQTNHFTLFTSLVSTVITNADETLVEGITQTTQAISKFLGDIPQTIKLTAGKDISQVLTVVRDGQKINLSNIFLSGLNKMSNTKDNLVSFAIGDIIQTNKQGSVTFNLQGYTTLKLEPGSSLKISQADQNGIFYENIAGETNYNFQKKSVPNFQYKIKGKVSYAVIRGTTLSVKSDEEKDIYALSEGSLEINNEITTNKIILKPNEQYIVYNNGKEEIKRSPTIQAYYDTSVGKIESGAYLAAKLLFEKGITKLTPENAPYYQNLTRRESALLIGRFAKNVLNKPLQNINNCIFSDLQEIDEITKTEIVTACQLGLFKGFQNKFMPANQVTKGQIVMVFARLLTSNPTMEVDASYDYLLNKNIITLDDRSTNANNPINRKEIYNIISNSMK